MNLNELAKDLLSGNRTALGKAITLIESNNQKDRQLKIDLFDKLSSASTKSIRVGIIGVPGSGKSTTINSITKKLIEKKHKVAIIAVDPSSEINKGSVLGDEIRMNDIINNKNVYIRPVASLGETDGINSNIFEIILLCEKTGFDYIFIETVGAGQSAIEIKNVCDCVLNLQIGGTGDDIQSIKKGVLEIVDIIGINKYDGENKKNVESSLLNIQSGLHIAKQKYNNWNVPIIKISNKDGIGIEKLIVEIENFIMFLKDNDLFEKNRTIQTKKWIKKISLKNITEKISTSETFNRLLNKNIKQNNNHLKIINKIENEFK